MTDRAAQTTRLLRDATDGAADVSEDLFPLVYDELREIAQRLVRADRKQTLQPTELIHEAYLRLVDHDDSEWQGRLHFQRVAARAMRFVLVDRARARLAGKRGGGQRPVTLDEGAAALADDADNVLNVHEGLDKLRADDPQLADIVELRFFGGFGVDEAAKVLGVSASTIKRGWRVARAWWLEELGE